VGAAVRVGGGVSGGDGAAVAAILQLHAGAGAAGGAESAAAEEQGRLTEEELACTLDYCTVQLYANSGGVEELSVPTLPQASQCYYLK
jgi:hypothetical protein